MIHEYAQLRDDAVALAREAGNVLRRHFGRVIQVRAKESWASVVSEADIESEACIIRALRQQHPDDGILAEESGRQPGATDRTWVIDPLDGTSNFVAGLPWFGVMVAVLDGAEPVAGAIHLPLEEVTYAGAKGGGVTRNGTPVRVTPETDLRQLLLGYSFDPALDEAGAIAQGLTLARLARAVRNVRSTNSMLDFVFTIDGRFGGCLNQATRIWDIAAPLLLFEEAGGRLTGLDGRPLSLDLGPAAAERNYAVLGASQALHRQLVRLLASQPPSTADGSAARPPSNAP